MKHENERIKAEQSNDTCSIQHQHQHQHLVLDDTTIRAVNDATTIRKGEFDDYSETLETVTILESSGINCIGESAFYGYRSLQSVQLPDSVTTIGKRAFFHCSSLQSVNIPNGVTTIEWYAFRGCLSLQSIDIPNDVVYIGMETFYGCKSLQSITIPNGVTTIGNGAFARCYSLQSVIIPIGVRTISSRAFYMCRSLQSIHIPNSVTDIGVNTFLGCYKLDQRHTDGTNYNPDMVTWLRQRFDNLPIHQTCYYIKNNEQSTVDLLSKLIQGDNQQALAATDAMDMTPLDILCCNSRATVEMVQLLVENDPSLQQTGLTPFMLAASLPVCRLGVVYALAINGLDIVL